MSVERRIFERFSARFPVKFKDSRDEYGTDVFLRDASAWGVRFITCERLYLDDPVALEVKVHGGEFPTVLRGRVVWTRPANAAMWDVGLQFHKVDFMNMSRLFESALQS
ncbi:MAG: PilZ domain-containing protein [Candidatus Omnitrophica bacterium]|nr:PilZ domain-containing protein [Candidatus Omnitrophota bacterium]